MKKIFLTLTVCFALTGAKALAQKTDSVQPKYVAYLKTELAVDDAKAKQVAAVMDDYKAKAKALEAAQMSNEEKEKKWTAITTEKNSKLEKLLTETQLGKMLPASERKKGKKQAQHQL